MQRQQEASTERSKGKKHSNAACVFGGREGGSESMCLKCGKEHRCVCVKKHVQTVCPESVVHRVVSTEGVSKACPKNVSRDWCPESCVQRLNRKSMSTDCQTVVNRAWRERVSEERVSSATQFLGTT